MKPNLESNSHRNVIIVIGRSTFQECRKIIILFGIRFNGPVAHTSSTFDLEKSSKKAHFVAAAAGL